MSFFLSEKRFRKSSLESGCDKIQTEEDWDWSWDDGCQTEIAITTDVKKENVDDYDSYYSIGEVTAPTGRRDGVSGEAAVPNSYKLNDNSDAVSISGEFDLDWEEFKCTEKTELGSPNIQEPGMFLQKLQCVSILSFFVRVWNII